MGPTKSPSQPAGRRIENVHEVVLGFGKKQNLEESRRCPQCAQPTCMGESTGKAGCPLGIDIPGFIRFLREDDTASALERIRQANPFPAICGRICPAPCEQACIFYEEGAPVAIRSLERYAADFGRAKLKDKPAAAPTGKAVAIIGSGPSGMAAAFYLAKAGCQVTVYEAMPYPGGLLRYGVPEFRLPEKVLNDQIDELKNMGIEFITNVLVGSSVSVREIFARNPGAVLLTVGAGVPQFTEFPGSNSVGVYYAEELLARAQLAAKGAALESARGLWFGPQTVVLGGGTAALDAARLVVRCGQSVDVLFGGLEEEMGVYADDLKAAVEEGVRIHAPVEALSILSDSRGFVTGVAGRRLELMEKDGKLFLGQTPEGEVHLEAQTVVLCAGRRPNPFLKHELPQLKWNEDGSLWTDPNSGLTSIDKVFAAGNVATGAGPVVNAIASGKHAAQQILDFLSK